MKPYYEEDNIQIFLGDCLEILPTFVDKSFDLVLTDPPYKVISGGQTKTADKFYKNGKWNNDGKIFEYNNFLFTTDFFNGLYRILKDGTHIYWFTNFLNLNMFLTIFNQSEFYMHNLLVWIKKPIVNRWYMKNCEYVIFAKKGMARPINNKNTNTVVYFNQPENKRHPTEKPIKLMELYIKNSTNEGDLILDPFAGSCTTLVAAKKLGRRAIGIEISEKYCEIGKNRLEELDRQPSLLTTTTHCKHYNWDDFDPVE